MNKQRILALADLIETQAGPSELGFCLEVYVGDTNESEVDTSGYSCDTAACIAGWAFLAYTPAGRRRPMKTAYNHANAIVEGVKFFDNEEIVAVARLHLGLGTFLASSLFCPSPRISPDPYTATPARAARVLRHLARTGEVDWTLE